MIVKETGKQQGVSVPLWGHLFLYYEKDMAGYNGYSVSVPLWGHLFLYPVLFTPCKYWGETLVCGANRKPEFFL